MALFDSNKVMYLSFYIVLTDRDRVAELQALYPGGVNRAPWDPSRGPGTIDGGAAVEFAAPWIGYAAPKLGQAPCTWTPWSVSATGESFPVNVGTFQQHTGGFWGIGGTTTRYYWMGQFLFNEVAPTDGGGVAPPAPAPIAQRYWIEGFETPGLGPCAYSTTGLIYSRDASRHVGGLGLAFRGASNAYLTIDAREYDAALEATQFWQRGYIRLRKKPTSVTPLIWRSHQSTAGNVGFALGVTPTGQLALFGCDNALVYTLLDTGGALEAWTGLPNHDAWVKLDILVDYVAGTCDVYVRGVPVLSGTVAAVNEYVTTCKIGNSLSAANDLNLDYDDWGLNAYPTDFTGQDWLSGSSIRLLRPTGYSAHHNGAAWAGDYRRLLQIAAGVGFPALEVTSSTADAELAVDTDSALAVDEESNAIGVAALLVCAYTKRGTTSGLLGYALNGAAAVMTALTESLTLAARSVLFTVPGDSPTFPDVTPIELLYTKGNAADAASIAALLGQVELVGKFGPEDYFESALDGITDPVPPPVGQHNAPYPRSPWAIQTIAPPISPYFVTGGTYVGNGTGQDLTFPAPIHWLFIRATTPAAPFLWFSTMLLSHKSYQIGMDGQIVNVDTDPDYDPPAGTDAQQQQYRVRLAGNSAQLNANGVTYQYIAVGDPGMRYMLNTQLAENTARPQTITRLVDPGYLPEFAFVHPQVGAATTTGALYAQGPGSTEGALACFTGGAALADAFAFGTGEFATLVALHAKVAPGPIAVSLWRRHDGQADTDEASVFNIGGYVGDGAASRTINLAPTCGRRPLFAMVFSEFATGYHRDPSHTGTNSANSAGANATTGITAGGIDQFSVGSSLNSSTVRYIYFVLFADATAGNNGWGVNGTIWPVEPTWPGGAWPHVPVPPVEPPPVTPPGGVTPSTTLTTDLEANCVAWSTQLVNLALSRIGISKALVSLATDVSEEGYTARLHYGIDAGRVLRDFSWPFATRYADLVLVAGTDTVPVNGDWQYAYRAPTTTNYEMIRARRIVGQAQQRRTYDPNPIGFRVGSDATGLLIYCNEPATVDVPLQLEYTIRVDCPASAADPLFRSAFAWRLASSLVAPLARDVKLIDYCDKKYREELARASATAATEQQQDPDGDASWISGRN